MASVGLGNWGQSGLGVMTATILCTYVSVFSKYSVSTASSHTYQPSIRRSLRWSKSGQNQVRDTTTIHHLATTTQTHHAPLPWPKRCVLMRLWAYGKFFIFNFFLNFFIANPSPLSSTRWHDSDDATTIHHLATTTQNHRPPLPWLAAAQTMHIWTARSDQSYRLWNQVNSLSPSLKSANTIPEVSHSFSNLSYSTALEILMVCGILVRSRLFSHQISMQ